MEQNLETRRAASPRPDFMRPLWLDLCGQWEFEPDPANLLDGDERVAGRRLAASIRVPFVPQSRASGIGDTGFSPCLWYRCSFTLDAAWEGRRAILCFGAVDSECTVWVNGRVAGFHRGGYTSFRLDVTAFVHRGENVLLVKVRDDLDPGTPRGKQAWGAPFACWYTPMSGIWQPVWIEAAGDTYVRDLVVEDVDPFTGRLSLLVTPNQPKAAAGVEIEVRREGRLVSHAQAPLAVPSTRLALEVPEVQPWSPDAPALYDLTARVRVAGEIVDVVDSYVGFRRFAIDEEGVLVNGRRLPLRLVLDQGLWPDTLYSAPSGDALRADIEIARQLGFNGCRKHNKAEDPRFLYWADRLGFLVWAEVPSAYSDGERTRRALASQLAGQVERDRNHPALMAWVVYNESWGIRDVSRSPEVRDWVRELAGLARRLDPTRLVISNDGWEHVDSDLYTFHTYAPDPATFDGDVRAFRDGGRVGEHRLLAEEGRPGSRPLVASEIGGIGFAPGAIPRGGWGYARIAASAEELERRMGDLLDAVRGTEGLAGFCYTQLTDTEQEINGLLTAERTAKIPVAKIRKIITGKE